MSLFETMAKITIDTSEYDSKMDEADRKGKGFAKSFKGGLATVGKAFAGFGAAAAGGVLAINGLIESTEEYRVAAGKLSTAFESAGMSQETANKAYSDFYAIIGDTDTATEAAQLLSHLAKSEEDVAEWSRIAAGVAGQFGDSLPVESLIEASNETAKVGEVTGTLADALNWVGVNEDEFNAQLSELSTEEERNQLITETLTDIYGEAGDAFTENNKAIIEQRKNQALLDESMGRLGEAFLGVRNSIMSYFLPGIANASEAIADLVTGDGSMVEKLGRGFELFENKMGETVPRIIDLTLDAVDSLARTFIENNDKFVAKIKELVPKIVDVALDAIERFTKTFADNSDKIVSSAADIIIAFVVGLVKSLPKIIEAGTKIILNLTVGIIKATPSLMGKLDEIVNGIWQSIINVKNDMVEAGRQLIAGLWQGIKDRAGWIGDKVAGFINGIKARFTGKSGFDIHSPSKWAAEVGYRIPEGMADGFGRGAHLAINQAQALTSSMQGAIKADFNGRFTGSTGQPANVVRMPEYRPEPQVIQVTLELDGEVLARKMVKYNESETVRRGVPLLGGA